MTEMEAGLRAIFERHRDEFERRMRTLEQASAMLVAGALDEDHRAGAARDAHKLFGSLGTLGLPGGSRLAREIEAGLGRGGRRSRGDDAHLARCVAALLEELDAGLPARPIEVLIVEDHPPVREGLELLLPRHGFRTIGSARGAGEGARMIRARRPDVALVDIDLGDGSGTDLAAGARDEGLPTAVVLYTAAIDRDLVDATAACGAAGLVLKSSPMEHVADAIRAAAAGRNYVDPSLTRMLRPASAGVPRRTSVREAEVLGMLALGRTTGQIADELCLSPATVQTHVRNATGKLGARGRLHAVILALVNGEIELPAKVG
jgi:DNA-binding NarL/FixJ family response regulator